MQGNGPNPVARAWRSTALVLAIGVLGWSRVADAADARGEVSTAGGDEIQISLLTMGPGDHPFFKFGHDALWVHDPGRSRDAVYNYGTFEFDSTLIPRFLRGRFDYWLSVQSLPGTLAAYAEENRSIVAQELRLTAEQKLTLVHFLDWNARKQNRYYRYDYYLDNCSTRLRDLIDRVTEGRLRRVSNEPASMTFRAHTERLTADDWLVYVGLDVAMSDVIDRPITVWEEMFLPAKLEEVLRRATVPTEAGELPLVVSERILVHARRSPARPEPPKRTLPLLVLGLLLGGILALLGRAASRGGGASRVAFASLAGFISFALSLLGILFVLLWAFTNHRVAHHNENILQCAPWALASPVFAVGLARSRSTSAERLFQLTRAALLASVAGFAMKAFPFLDQKNLPFIALLLPVWAGMTAGTFWQRPSRHH